MTRRLLALTFLGALLAAGVKVAAPADAMSLGQVVETIKTSGGHYARGGASLKAADCSGLVSVAQSLAMGEKPRRLGNTNSLLAGQWPGAVPGASPGELFVIGVNPGHMVARVNGVNLEARQSGEGFRVGGDAASPFEPRFRQYHIDPNLIGV